MQIRPPEFRQAHKYGVLSSPEIINSTVPEFIEEKGRDVCESAQTLNIGGRRYPSKIIALVKDILDNPRNEKRWVYGA